MTKSDGGDKPIPTETLVVVALLQTAGAILGFRSGLLPWSHGLAWATSILFSIVAVWGLNALSRRARRSLLARLCVFTWVFLLMGSWWFRLRSRRFAAPDDVRLIPYLFEDYSRAVAIGPDLVGAVVVTAVLSLGVSFFLVRHGTGVQRRFRMVAVGAGALVAVAACSEPIRLGWRRTFPDVAFLSYLIGSLAPLDAPWYRIQPSPIRPASPAQPPRSVVVIVVEALRRDVLDERDETGALYMPFLNEQAAKGLAYRYAYAQASDSEMSLFALFTGRYSLQHTARPQLLGEDHIFAYMNQAGSETGLFSAFEWRAISFLRSGVSHFSDPTFDGGALELLRRREAEVGHPVGSQEIVFSLDELNTDRFLDWESSHRDRPIAALLNLYGSHFPYSGEYSGRYRTYYFPFSERDDLRREYLRAARRADALIARVVMQLQQRPDKPVVFITGDHGEEFYEHGGYLHAGALSAEVMNVTLLALGLPGSCLKPSEVDWPVGHIDILPTVLDLGGVDPWPRYQGLSLCGKPDSPRPLFASSRAMRHQDAVIFDGVKVVYSYDGGETEAYRIADDPLELKNLAGENALTERGKKMIFAYNAAQRIHYSRADYDEEIPPRYDQGFLGAILGPPDTSGR